MTVAILERDVFEDFEPVTDAYFFKIGSFGLISFYGRNYTIKKRLSAEEQQTLLSQPNFMRVAHQCYVNKDKITTLHNQMILFEDKESYPKSLTISPWMHRHVRKQLAH